MKYSNLVNIEEFFLKNKTVLLHIDSDYSSTFNKFSRKFDVVKTILHLLKNDVKLIILSTGKRYRTHREYLDHKTNSKDFYNDLLEKIGSNRNVAQYTETTRHEYIIKVIDQLPPSSLLFLDNAFNNDFNDKEITNFESNYENDLGAYWAGLCDLYIDDNFANAYHKLSSNFGIEKFKNDASGVGYLIGDEIETISILKKKISTNSTLILSGLVSEKNLDILSSSLTKFDNVVLMGELSYLFLNIKLSSKFKINYDENLIKFANKIYKKYIKKITLPVDFLCSEKNKTIEEAKTLTIEKNNFENQTIFDIGNESIDNFKNIIKNSNSIVVCNLSSNYYNTEMPWTSSSELLDEINAQTKLGKISIIGWDNTYNQIISQKYQDNDAFSYLSSGDASMLLLLLDDTLLGLEGVSKKANFFKKLFK